MNKNERKAAANLIAGHQEALTSGVEGEILRRLLPAGLYEDLLSEIEELHEGLLHEEEEVDGDHRD